MAEGTVVEKLITRVSLEGVAEVQRGQRLVGAGLRALSGDAKGAAASLKSLKISTLEYGAAGAAMLGAAAGIVAVLRNSIPAAIESEKAQHQLQVALRGTGEASAANMAKFRAFADEMMRLTVADDEQILSGMALAHNMGIQTNSLEGTTKAALALAAVSGMDIPSAFSAVGKGVNGMTRGLKNFVPGIADAKTKQERLNLILEWGAKNFNKAQAATNTTEGAYMQFQNSVGEVQEALGGGLAPVMGRMAQLAKSGADWFTKFNDSIGGIAGWALAGVAGLLALGGVLLILKGSVTGLAWAWDLVRQKADGAAAAQSRAAAAGSGAGGAAANVGTGAAVGGGIASKAGGILGKLGTAAAIWGIGSSIGGAVSNWGKGGKQGSAQRGFGSVGGNTLEGAAVGAALGSILPGVGTAIGGAVGGLVGAIGGVVRLMGEERKESRKASPRNPVVESNRHLADIAKLLKDQKQAIVGGGPRAAAALNRGDLQRALYRTLAAQVI